MRVKKYKRVKRLKVYVEPPESFKGRAELPLTEEGNTSFRSCKKPEGNGDIEKGEKAEHHYKNDTEGPERGKEYVSEERTCLRDCPLDRVNATPIDTERLYHPETSISKHPRSEKDKVAGSSSAGLPGQSSAEAPHSSVQPDSQTSGDSQIGNVNERATNATVSTSPENPSPTPRTIPCSDEGSANPSPLNEDGSIDGQPSKSASSKSTEFENSYASMGEEEESANVSALGPGSLLFKAERVACFLQLLSLGLDVEGAAWPPLFSSMWGWTWFTTEYLRWPLLALLQRVGRALSLTFGEAEHDLRVFHDVVGYGAEVCVAGVAVFVLFFVLQVPDYTSHKPRATWKRRFLTHWFRSSLPRYIFNLSLAHGCFAALVIYGASILPGEVVTAVAVVGGTVVTVAWFLVVAFSFFVHVTLRMATKHDEEYSFMIAMKNVVKIKVRACLLFLHLAYIPMSASIARALLPVFDWNDNWAFDSRRPYNHHVWCYFLGFPPQAVGIAETTVLECTSLSGVSVHTLSACIFLLYTCGLSNLVRYLVRFLVVAFERKDDVIKSFLQARETHHTTLLALRKFPQDAVWLARRQRELALVCRATDRAGRRIRSALSFATRRIPFIHNLPCLRKSCRRKKKHDAFLEIGSDSDGDGFGIEGIANMVNLTAQKKDAGGSQEEGSRVRVGFKSVIHDGSVVAAPHIIQAALPTGGERPGTAQTRPSSIGRPLSRAAAAVMARADAKNAGIVGRDPDRHQQSATGSIAGLCRHYFERRSLVCVGLQSALESERDACANAREEYVRALSDFESDHSLEITCWESVVDTSGLVYLAESYSWLRPDWKAVECLERGTFVIGMLVAQLIAPATTQLLVGAMILVFFQVWTLKAEPFLHCSEALLDSCLRIALILVLCIGAAGAGGFLWHAAGDTFLLIVGTAGIALALFLGDAPGAAVALARRMITFADSHVNDLLFHQVKKRSLGLEVCHTGIRLLMQWDDLLEQQRWSAFMAWPSPTPGSILTKQEKMLVVRWAAFRGIDIRRARTSTALNLLHDAIISAEVEPARWLVFLYPMLLDAETLHKESPLLLGMLETARVLLRLEVVQALIEKAETIDFDNASRSTGEGWIVGRGKSRGDGGGGEAEGQTDLEREEVELSWKIGRLMEIFLSNELQNADVRWNAHQYDLLTEHGEPDLAELAQHLAQAFHLKPPKGYAAAHRWRKRARSTRDYLGEATCSSTRELDLGNCGLGDSGYKTLLSVCRAISSPATTFTWPSTYVKGFPTTVTSLNLSGNRMHRKSGYRVADMLLLNKTVINLDLSLNSLDSQAASEIFVAVRKNRVLKRLTLAGNKIGPEASNSLADMITKNQSLVYLDLSDNSMGERKFWLSESKFVHVPSAGPTLGESLRFNRTLVVLKVKGNQLGSESGRAFANGVAKHRSLTSLDLSGNHILPDGGKALALRLNFPSRSSISSLTLSDNHLGDKVAKLFSVTLRQNKTLQHLDLAHNELNTPAGIALAGALRTNRNLAFLSVAGNNVGPKAAKALAQTLAENCTLTGVDLSDNSMGVATADGGDPVDVGLALGIGLRSNATLTSLNLSGNRLPVVEVQRITEAMCDHPSLAYLDFAGESVNDSAAIDLGHLAAVGRVLALDLVGSALAGSGAVALARGLSSASRLTRLDISDNLLGDAAVRELATSLPADGFVVRVLGLARCGLGPVGGVLVAKALGQNRSVEELDLADNGLGSDAGLALAKSLRVLYHNGIEVRPCRMIRLDVSLNPIGNEAGVAIVGALVNECTRHLDMSYTELRGVVAGRAIGHLLRCHTIALRYLNVEHNTLGREGINEMFWALRRNASLVHLDVSDNGAGPAFGTDADKLEEYGTTSINSALSLNQTIRFLDLGTNGLSAECGITLTASIRKNRSLAKVSLENNELNDEAASMMARKLRKDRQIEYLNLNNNRIRWRGGQDLAGALGVNTHLRFLDVGNNRLGEGGTFAAVGTKFGDALVCNKTLTLLNLEGNRLGPEGGVAIAEALHRNNSLVDLNIENNRFDQDVGFALEDLLKVNFSLKNLRASTSEIGLDCRATIDDMLAAREKLLEVQGGNAFSPGFVANNFTAGPAEGNQRGSVSKTSAGGSGSEGSVGSMGTAGRGARSGASVAGGRRSASSRALRARQTAMVAARKGSTGSRSFRR